MIFVYHVKYSVILEEGDFFGLIGLIMIFCLLMCYDGMGVIHLYTDRMAFKHHNEDKVFNYKESNELGKPKNKNYLKLLSII